ncbi:phospholipase A [Alysiella filiformis]|uniref:Phospholipase A1 n=1 Tax=Alysiella filiformis DSM 16848 TaxID=1120981 RepID=A0A286EKT2_9NEIS|nr:phospholipase A [Alysiella filiformis]QMT30968.1 phospholipase A [Alysiella filiformis]UBQ56045.1 phospholipase A [Alysiella filiformis DSM 16848]SOD71521.1 phospholipase A1 [Alysiella filiformis DSM 16848]
MKKIFLPLSLFAVIHTTHAASAEHCATLSDNAQRLACYDQLFAPNQIKKASKAVLDLDKSYEKSRATGETEIVISESQITPTSKEDEAFSSLSFLYDLDKNSSKGILSVREHEPMYIMPAWYNTSPNYTPHSPSRGTSDNDIQKKQKRVETKMQMSFKTKLMEDVFKTRSDLWFGYTQQSNWQMYTLGDKSAPFRNNDYAPEIFMTQPVKANLPWGGKLRVLGAGYVHHSNGQSRPLSRSWNRGYVFAGMEWGNLTVVPRIWTRIDPETGEKDDNPDIMRYMGYGDLKFMYKFNDKHAAAATVRFNPKHGYGAIQADYVFPIKGRLKGYVRGFHGYGENLLEYNHKQTGIGLGVMLQGWDKH